MGAEGLGCKVGIDFRGDDLHVDLEYERRASLRDEIELRKHFSKRFSEKAGREVPIDDVDVSPRVGERSHAITHFRVRMGEEFYKMLRNEQKREPWLFPLVIREIEGYRDGHQLSEDRAILVSYAIYGLRKLVRESS